MYRLRLRRISTNLAFPSCKSGGTNLFSLAWSMDTHNPYFQRDPEMMPFYPSQEIWSPREVEDMHAEVDRSRFKGLYEDMLYYNDYHLGVLI